MAVTLGYSALNSALTMCEAIDLLEQALTHEAAGKTMVSPKYVTEFDGGSMRVLVAADHAAGYFATKAYHIIQGAGVRYVVTLYRLSDGELLAMLDGQIITDLRTGAASGVIARRVKIDGAVSVGILGSGNQAHTQLESIAAVYNVESADVYSPTVQNREAYARDMSAKLGIKVKAVSSAEQAARGHQVVIAASSARGSEPILRGAWLGECRLLCAVGNTRAQFAEADADCFRNASLVVVDSWHAIEEAGDLRQAVAAGALPEAKRASLAQIVTGAVTAPDSGLVAFKSVGTALQDLALAVRYYQLLAKTAGVPVADDLARLR